MKVLCVYLEIHVGYIVPSKHLQGVLAVAGRRICHIRLRLGIPHQHALRRIVPPDAPEFRSVL